MSVLLDECLPRKLSVHLVGHEVLTVPQAGWAGLKNGKLLAAAQDSFDVFVTIDQNLVAQQNVSNIQIAVIVLESISNELEHLVPLVPQLLSVLKEPSLTGIYRVR